MPLNWKERLKAKRLLKPLTILTLLLGFFFVSTMLVSKERSLSSLQQAFEERDVTTLKQLLSSTDANMTITSDDIERFLTYLDSFKKDKESLLEAIKLGQNHERLSINTQKKWMFFEDYVFQVKPIFIEFTVDEYVKEIEIVGAETLHSDGSEKIRSGPLMPGMYDIIATHHMGYVPDYTSKKHVNAIPIIANDEDVIKTEFNTRYVIFQLYNGHGATLLVNGKETEIIIDNEKKIYGIPKDGSVSLSGRKKFPWGEFTSEEVLVNRKEVFLRLDVTNDKVKEQLLKVANEFGRSWQQAFNKRDISLLKHVTPKMRERLNRKITFLNDLGVTTLKTTKVSEDFTIYLQHDEVVERRELPTQKEHYIATVYISETFENYSSLSHVFFIAYYNLEMGTWIFNDIDVPGTYTK
jgi:uncharacterized membrane protein YvbJ